MDLTKMQELIKKRKNVEKEIRTTRPKGNGKRLLALIVERRNLDSQMLELRNGGPGRRWVTCERENHVN